MRTVNLERELLDQLERQIEILNSILGTGELDAIYRQLEGKLVDPITADRYINQINYEYDRLVSEFDNYARRTVISTVQSSSAVTFSRLMDLENIKPWGMDTKAINTLIKNMQSDFAVTAKNGKDYFRSYVEFSKQGMITESQIDTAVAKGYLSSGTNKLSKQFIKEDLLKAINEKKYNPILKPYYKAAKTEEAALRAKLMGDIDNSLKSEILKFNMKEKMEAYLKDQKYMFLINKNGDVMRFKVKTYANLVARTRLGEAQIVGTLQAGIAKGINYYRVTYHNTKTKVCIPYENKILTTDRNDSRYPFLSKSTSPLYHVNCQHRLNPVIRDRDTGEYLD